GGERAESRRSPPASPRNNPIGFNGIIAIRCSKQTGIGLAYPTPIASQHPERANPCTTTMRELTGSLREGVADAAGAVAAHLFIFFDWVLRAIFPAYDHRPTVFHSRLFLSSVTAGGRPLRRTA